MGKAGSVIGTIVLGILGLWFLSVIIENKSGSSGSYSPPTSNRTYADEDGLSTSDVYEPYEVEMSTSSGTYTLEADINYLGEDEYEVEQVHWPNGGWFDFSDCVMGMEEDTTCTNSHGDDVDIYILAP